MKNNFKIKLIILLAALLFGRGVLAASLELNANKHTLQENEKLDISVVLNTDGQSINTIEGDLKYDDKFFQAESVNIGNSFINFWIEKPDVKTPGIIHFSGITPGGINTSKSEALKVIFTAKRTGDTSLSLDNVSLLLNDGQGSSAPVTTKNAEIKISTGKNIPVVVDEIANDKIAPEKFNIIRARDTSLFDGKYFVVFSTLDKGSGIDHYEVCEFWKCTKAESPFLLSNQTPFYRVVVNAYDLNGNHTSSSLTSPWIIFFFVLPILFAFFVLFRFYRKYL